MYNPFRKKTFVGELHSAPIMRRHPANPLLTADDVPYPASFVFNAGVTKFQGRYFIAPRVDVINPERGRPDQPDMSSIGTGFGTSSDGIHFDFAPELIRVHYRGGTLPWVCDARLTVL